MFSLLYNVLIVLVSFYSLRNLRKRRAGHNFKIKDLSFFLILGFVGLFVALLVRADLFIKMRLLCWLLFVHVPVYLAFFCWHFEKRYLLSRIIIGGGACALALVGIDAFFIEPYALEVTHRQIASPKLDQRIRIAVLADIQTDRPGAYDQRVFAEVKAQKPDLILFAGDYIQIEDPHACQAATDKLNVLLKEADFNPPLGMIAVQGNIDYERPWQDVFNDTPTITVSEDQTIDLGPVVVTGLSMTRSFFERTHVDSQEKYHIVLGHAPDFALGAIQADLLFAGHTHGGQVRLPFIGPLLTFSKVPRSWAAGQTEISPNKYLIVSRGIGMERETAPRMRFLCRPELVIVDLIPAE